MIQANYIKRLDAANGDPRLMIEAQGEYTAGLIATVQTEVIQLRAVVADGLIATVQSEVIQLRAEIAKMHAEIARLTDLIETHVLQGPNEKAISHGAPQ